MMLQLFMEDIGLPLEGPVPVGEDNAALRIIAHSGKITRNVRHVALKTRFAQNLVRFAYLRMREVGSDANRADHFAKILPGPAFREHTQHMMGLRFLTTLHIETMMRRRRKQNEKKQLTNEDTNEKSANG